MMMMKTMMMKLMCLVSCSKNRKVLTMSNYFFFINSLASEWNAELKDADVVAIANGENVPTLSAREKPEPSFFEKLIGYVVLPMLGLIQLL